MRQKAAIVYMTRSTSRDLHDLQLSLQSLDIYFNDRFQYPVIVFHEDLTPEMQRGLESVTRSRLSFVKLEFEFPAHLKPQEIPERILGRFNLGYRHMCRFFAGQIFLHPALREYDWYWRLDTDSFLRGRVSYDVFDHMTTNDYWYGYIAMLTERPEVVTGLWDAVQTYRRRHKLIAPLLQKLEGQEEGGWNLHYYYNNFEICRLAFGRSQAYLDFFRYIDDLGGIYKHRWGDAPIRTLAVALLVPPEKVHQFAAIPYSHNGYYTHRRHELWDRVKYYAGKTRAKLLTRRTHATHL